jgi:RNA polymerase sigma-70 factor (ECF subfamily)
MSIAMRPADRVERGFVPARDDDVALVRAIGAGDAGAPLAAFYDRYAPRVMAVLVRMLGSRAEAEDAAQEILIQVITHLAQWRGDSTLRTCGRSRSATWRACSAGRWSRW